MPKIKYENLRFSKRILNLIETGNAILKEYDNDGLSVTLRQLYYQFVSRGIIPNTVKSYKVIVNTMTKARLAGLMDWDSIEDRTRQLKGFGNDGSPEDAISYAARSYVENLWRDQKKRVEIWVEKDALAGVIERAASRYRVPFFSCRGYTSISEVWGASERMKNDGRPVVIIHLGDHDPSGIDMSRDIEERLLLTFGLENLTVRRIALNMDQVRKYNPPPNPAKTTDSRCMSYVRQFGKQSWELDALEPRVMQELINKEVEKHVDKKIWTNSLEKEIKNKATLLEISDNYDDVVAFLRDRLNG